MNDKAVDPSLAALLDQVAPAATPEGLGAAILSHDPQARHMTPRERLDAVRLALEDGRATAARMTSRDPWRIAADLGVPVERVDRMERQGTVLHFADYRSRPLGIRLFLPALDRLDALLSDPEISGRLGLTAVEPAFLAHELYHHLDLSSPSPVSRRIRVTNFRLGPFKLTSGLHMLGEVAAGAFAQALLDLPTHPKLLDLLALFDADPTAAQRWADHVAFASTCHLGLASAPR